jgi:hypothetical protein
LNPKEEPVPKWSDIAEFVGPTPNENPGEMASVLGVVLHIQQGNEAGSLAWCKNPASQVSAHFFAPKVGVPVQLVDTADKAWAEMAGNARWLSVENEGYSGQDLTRDQIEANAQILARAHRELIVPIAASDSVDRGGLGWHGMGGDFWGGHPDCPGQPVILQRPAILQRALVILGQSNAPVPPAPVRNAPPWPGRTFVYAPGSGTMLQGQDIHDWQARMHLRGWNLAVDGWYGPRSATVCWGFQEDSTHHGWLLHVDGEVGPLTWAAAWERPVTR